MRSNKVAMGADERLNLNAREYKQRDQVGWARFKARRRTRFASGGGRSADVKPKAKLFPVVGVAGSAGGYESFNRFLARLPEDTGMAFDFFLRSFAEDLRQNAIGMIFSGTGSDGTLGLEAIKGVDGLTFAQKPGTAQPTGMAGSAIASGWDLSCWRCETSRPRKTMPDNAETRVCAGDAQLHHESRSTHRTNPRASGN
jgi:chemotaxis response regulator CheB